MRRRVCQRASASGGSGRHHGTVEIPTGQWCWGTLLSWCLWSVVTTAQSTTNTNNNTQSIIIIPVASCVVKMSRADGDGDRRLNRSEYFNFLRSMSPAPTCPSQFDQRGSSNLNNNTENVFQQTFDRLACLCQEYVNTSNEAATCCASEATRGISLIGTFVFEYTQRFCENITLLLLQECSGPLPPTRSPVPTPDPSRPPSAQPTALRTIRASAAPSPQPTGGGVLPGTSSPTRATTSNAPSTRIPTAQIVISSSAPSKFPSQVPSPLIAAGPNNKELNTTSIASNNTDSSSSSSSSNVKAYLVALPVLGGVLASLLLVLLAMRQRQSKAEEIRRHMDPPPPGDFTDSTMDSVDGGLRGASSNQPVGNPSSTAPPPARWKGGTAAGLWGATWRSKSRAKDPNQTPAPIDTHEAEVPAPVGSPNRMNRLLISLRLLGDQDDYLDQDRLDDTVSDSEVDVLGARPLPPASTGWGSDTKSLGSADHIFFDDNASSMSSSDGTLLQSNRTRASGSYRLRDNKRFLHREFTDPLRPPSPLAPITGATSQSARRSPTTEMPRGSMGLDTGNNTWRGWVQTDGETEWLEFQARPISSSTSSNESRSLPSSPTPSRTSQPELYHDSATDDDEDHDHQMEEHPNPWQRWRVDDDSTWEEMQNMEGKYSV